MATYNTRVSIFITVKVIIVVHPDVCLRGENVCAPPRKQLENEGLVLFHEGNWEKKDY